MKKSILSFTFLTLVIFLHAQPSIEWQVSFGSSGWDHAEQIEQTEDGGFILTAYAAANDHDAIDAPGGGDLWIIKFDASGEKEWEYLYGGSLSDGGNSIQQTTDQGYIIAGLAYSSDGDLDNNYGSLDAWIVKLNEFGLLEWQKNYGGSDHDIAKSIQETTDGGYIVAGNSQSSDGDLDSNYGGRDFWIFKINSTGNLEWKKNYGGSDQETANSIQQTTDGGYVVAGITESNDGDVGGNHDLSEAWILKLDEQGNIEWKNLFGGSNADVAYEIEQTTDGGYIVAGLGSALNGKYWILKINSSGIFEWDKNFGGSIGSQAHSVQQTADEGYIATGYTVNSSGNHSVLTIKLDSNGGLEWQKLIGGSLEDRGNHIRQTTDGGYIICGVSWSSDGDLTNNQGLSDLWIVKLTGTTPTATHELTNLQSMDVHPNPSNGSFIVNIDQLDEAVDLHVFDVLGKRIYSRKNIGSSHQIDNLPKGIFWLQVTGDKYASTKKIVRQ